MIIKEFLVERMKDMHEKRVVRLEEIGAPKIILRKEAEILEKLRAGELPSKVGGEKELLDVIYRSHVPKNGRGGKVYIEFNDGEVLFFPEARYGMYIKGAE